MTLNKDRNDIFCKENGKLVQIIIPATTDFSSSLRDIIWALLENDTKYSSRWRYRIQLIAEELINNAVEHWSIKTDDIIIDIAIFDNSNIEILVTNNWNWKKKIKAKDLIENIKLNREAMLINPSSNKTIRWRWLAMIVLGWSDSFEYIDNLDWWLTAKITKKFIPEYTDENPIPNKLDIFNLHEQIKITTKVF